MVSLSTYDSLMNRLFIIKLLFVWYADVGNFGTFLPFLRPLQAPKHYQIILSCKGVSKLRFGGSYAKISYKLALGMSFFYKICKSSKIQNDVIKCCIATRQPSV